MNIYIYIQISIYCSPSKTKIPIGQVEALSFAGRRGGAGAWSMPKASTWATTGILTMDFLVGLMVEIC